MSTRAEAMANRDRIIALCERAERERTRRVCPCGVVVLRGRCPACGRPDPQRRARS
jgi:hypothetical protein